MRGRMLFLVVAILLLAGGGIAYLTTGDASEPSAPVRISEVGGVMEDLINEAIIIEHYGLVQVDLQTLWRSRRDKRTFFITVEIINRGSEPIPRPECAFYANKRQHPSIEWRDDTPVAPGTELLRGKLRFRNEVRNIHIDDLSCETT